MRYLVIALSLVLLSCCASMPVSHWPNDPTAGVRVYHKGSSHNADSLIKWTDHYTDKLGLPRAHIIFQPLPHHWCGYAIPPTHKGEVVIAYNVQSTACRWIQETQYMALHEVCHYKLGHVYEAQVDDKREHKEVEKCVRQYW